MLISVKRKAIRRIRSNCRKQGFMLTPFALASDGDDGQTYVASYLRDPSKYLIVNFWFKDTAPDYATAVELGAWITYVTTSGPLEKLVRVLECPAA